MGCMSSKNTKRYRHSPVEFSPEIIVPRCYSTHVHHPSQHPGDSHHMVALTSSTLGSLKLCDLPSRHNNKHLEDINTQVEENNNNIKVNLEFQAALTEAKIWSSLINDKIPKIAPKTPISTPPGEPEIINTWELMEGLEDFSPLRSPNHFKSFSFSFDANGKTQIPKSKFDENFRSNDLDHEIISSFRKSLQEPPLDHPFHIWIPNMNINQETEESSEEEDLSDFKVILYFTSLRGIRKTYEDSCYVQELLKSLRIRLDERDVSMDSGFKDEVKKLLGSGISLPRVFLGNKYLGGAEEIKKMNENGTLKKLLENCIVREENECEG